MQDTLQGVNGLFLLILTLFAGEAQQLFQQMQTGMDVGARQLKGQRICLVTYGTLLGHLEWKWYTSVIRPM